MLNEREMRYRLSCAQDQGVPMTNYGMTISVAQGVIERVLGCFPEALAAYRRGMAAQRSAPEKNATPG